MKEPNFLNLHIIYGLRLLLEKQMNYFKLKSEVSN